MEPDHDPADDTATPGHRPRPWSKRVPADRGPFDTIVIGSGIGGMTTAALLARAGQRVLVLEQHYVPGGFTHAFRRKGFVWDVGVHLVGEMGPQAMPGRLMHTLTEGRLRWENVGPVYVPAIHACSTASASSAPVRRSTSLNGAINSSR